MKKELLRYLVCIYCGKELSLVVGESSGKDIIKGFLNCECGKSFLVKDGIPRMLKDYVESVKVETAKAFAFEWKSFSEIYQEYEAQFLDWISPVSKDFFEGKLVLDAGCGTGRHAFFAVKYGAEVIAVDLGDSVVVAKENTKTLKNVHVVQADIYQMPFKDKLFDYAYSIGVLHHLPSPQEGFNSIVSKIKRGGRVSAWVYGQENNFLLKFADPVRRFVFSKLPLKLNNFLASLITYSIWPVVKVYSLIDKTDLNKTPLVKLLPQYQFLVYFSKLNWRIVHSIIFDQMLAPVAFYLRKDEFEKWFTEAKLKNVEVTHRNNNSWRGTGVK